MDLQNKLQQEIDKLNVLVEQISSLEETYKSDREKLNETNKIILDLKSRLDDMTSLQGEQRNILSELDSQIKSVTQDKFDLEANISSVEREIRIEENLSKLPDKWTALDNSCKRVRDEFVQNSGEFMSYRASEEVCRKIRSQCDQNVFGSHIEFIRGTLSQYDKTSLELATLKADGKPITPVQISVLGSLLDGFLKHQEMSKYWVV